MMIILRRLCLPFYTVSLNSIIPSYISRLGKMFQIIFKEFIRSVCDYVVCGREKSKFACKRVKTRVVIIVNIICNRNFGIWTIYDYDVFK